MEGWGDKNRIKLRINIMVEKGSVVGSVLVAKKFNFFSRCK